MRSMTFSARSSPEWVERMRTTSVAEVAAALGRNVAPARGTSAGAVYGCPACNADRRHTKSRDKRGAVLIERSSRGWKCLQCDTGGDALDFVALALRGQKLAELGDVGKSDVREWCQRLHGLVAGAGTAVRPKLLERREATPPREPIYPPADELAAFWAECHRVDDDEEVAPWLERDRRIAAHAVADRELARAISRDSSAVPGWACFERKRDGQLVSWASVGVRLMVPLFDAGGVMRSMLFRRSFETKESFPAKSAGAKDCDRVGLGMMCPFARELMRTGRWPEWWPSDVPKRVVVAEGEMDFLTIATSWSDADETAPAVIGGFAGSWSLLAHVPTGSRVDIRTHADKDKPKSDGLKYANEILDVVRTRWLAGEIKLNLGSYFELKDERVVLR